MYNKREFNKINDKKVLHKVKKQWLVLSLSMLAIIGTGGAIATKTHASTMTPPQARPQETNATISDQANALHKNLMLNSTKSAGLLNNNSSQRSEANDTLPKGIDGMWNNAYYTFDSSTGALKVYGKRMNSKGNQGIMFNTLSAVKIPGKNSASPQYQSDMNHYPANDLHHNVNPNDIRSITVNNDGLVQMPNNSSYMFAGLPNLTSVDLTGLHKPAENNASSDITSTSHMFADDPKLRSVTLGNSIDPADLNDMSSMFSDDPALTSIDFGSLSNTRHADDLNRMFAGDGELADIKTALTANPGTNLQGMFAGDRSLRSLDLSRFNTYRDDVALMNNMLIGTTGLRILTLGPNTALSHDVKLPNTWYRRDVADDYTDVSPVNLTNDGLIPGIYTTNKDVNSKPDDHYVTGTWGRSAYSFDKRTGVLRTTKVGEIEALVVTGPDGHNISSLQGMSLSDLNDITEIDIDGNNTFLPQDHNDFADLPNLKKVDLSGLNTAGMNNTSYMFANDPALKEINFGSHFDTSKMTDMSGMFSNDKSLSQLDLSKFNVGNVTDMNWMFGNDTSLTALNLSNFDTGKLSNMYAMFYGDKSLNSVIFGSRFSTANVRNMSWVFSNDADLSSLDLSSFNTDRATTMDSMFSGDTNLANLKLGNQFNAANVTDMNDMFNGDARLSDLDLSSVNSVRAFNSNKMSDMLSGLTNLTRLQLGPYTYIRKNASLPNAWYKETGNSYTTRNSNSVYTTPDPSRLGYVFTNVPGTYVLNRNVNPAQSSDSDVTGNWGTASFRFNPITGLLQTTSPGVINPIQGMAKAIDLSKVRAVKFARGTQAPVDSTGLLSGKYTTVTTSDGMSEQESSLANLSDIDCTNLNTSNVTSMFEMFQNDVSLRSVQFGKWFNTGKVQLMGYMFNSDHKLNSLDLSNFNTQNVYDMRSMFYDDYELSDIDLNGFDTSKVSFISNMFNGDHALSKLNLGPNFDTSGMSHTSSSMNGMFANDYGLKKLDLGNKFYTSHVNTSVKSMSDMFTNDFSLTSLNLGPNFDVAKVSDMHDMFANDNNLRHITLGKDFDIRHAAAKTYPRKIRVKNNNGSDVMRQAYTRIDGRDVPDSYNGSSDIFANDDQLNTISGNNVKLNQAVGLLAAPGKGWSLKGTDSPVNLTDGGLHSGTYVFNEFATNPVVQTTLKFMDGSRNIGNLVVTGYNNTPIPYGEIEDSLGDGYSTNIKDLYRTIPNSPYKYTDGTIQVPVQHSGSSAGTAPVSATYVTLTGNVTLNFFNYADKKIKTLTIPYQINGVPVGFKVSDVLSHVTSGVDRPSDYLGKIIQAFPINDYSYQDGTGSNAAEYLNVPITVSDGKNASGTYVNGNYVNNNLTFNFKSNQVNEHITYVYNAAKEGSDDVQGDPGTKGDDVYMTGLKPGFVLSPEANLSFTFAKNNGSMTIPVQPGRIRVIVPFKVEDDSTHQVLAGLSSSRSMNRVPANEPSTVDLSPADLKALSNDGYQLDRGQSITVPLGKVNAASRTYDDSDFILYAHKIEIMVPVRFTYNGRQKGTGHLTGTMGKVFNDLSAKLASYVPTGYQINSKNNYQITNVAKVDNDKYYAQPLAVTITPVQETDVITFIDQAGHQIGRTVTKRGNDYRTVNGSFNVDTLSAPRGYRITAAGTLPYDGRAHSVTVTPVNGVKVPVKLVDTQTGKVIVPRQAASNEFTLNTPGTIQINQVPRGYRLAKSNHYAFTLRSSDVADGHFDKAPLGFGITPVDYTVPVLFDYENSIDNDPTFNDSTVTNMDSSFDLLNYAASVVPKGYDIKPGQKLSSWKLIDHLPDSGTGLEPVVIKIMPVQQKALAVYKNGDTSLSASPVDLGAGDTGQLDLVSSKFKLGSHPKGLPNGYQVVDPDQIMEYDDRVQPVAVTPIRATDTISYDYDGRDVTDERSTQRITGNEFVGTTTFDLASLMVPKGYQLSADNPHTEAYDNGHLVVNVKPMKSPRTSTKPTVPVEPSSATNNSLASLVAPVIPITPSPTASSNSASASDRSTVNDGSAQSVPTVNVDRTDRGYVIQRDAGRHSMDVAIYHDRKHVVRYHTNGRNTIRVKVNGHYKDIVVSTALPANNVSASLARAVDMIDFDRPAKHVWSRKGADQALNQIHVGEVVKYYGTKMARISVPANYRYLIVNKKTLAHLLISQVGNHVDKDAVPLKQHAVFHIDRVIVVHGKRGNYVRYEVKFNQRNFWITARKDYVKNAYLQLGNVKDRKIRVIRSCGLYSSLKYSKHTLVRDVKPGVKLTVRKVIALGKKGNDQTRLLLSNGDYVTANRRFVKIIK